MTPSDSIERDPPNVWLTCLYGFTPATWGFLGFSTDGQRKRFVRETQPGALVVIYGHKTKAPAPQRGMIIGIKQVSHMVNYAHAFMAPSEWERKQVDGQTKKKWNLAVRTMRAWRVDQENYLPIEQFAPISYSLPRAQSIGSQGTRLTRSEARRIFDLKLIETSVYGQVPVIESDPVQGRDLFQ